MKESKTITPDTNLTLEFTNKTCTKCNEDKHTTDFPINANTSTGLFAWCRSCLSTHRTTVKKKTCTSCKKYKPRNKYNTYQNGRLHSRCILCEIENPEVPGSIECTGCGIVKPKEDYFKSRQTLKRALCKDCIEDKYLEPDQYEKRRNSDLLKRYGITLEQYKELLEKQEHKCPVCLLPFEEGKVNYPVDHAHSGLHAGTVRAILHDSCNRFVMWKHKDPDMLRRAADLIETPLTSWMVPDAYIKGRPKKRKKKVKPIE